MIQIPPQSVHKFSLKKRQFNTKYCEVTSFFICCSLAVLSIEDMDIVKLPHNYHLHIL